MKSTSPWPLSLRRDARSVPRAAGLIVVVKSAIGASASFTRKILSSHPPVTRIVGDRLDCAAVLSGRSVWPNTGIDAITEMQVASAAVKVLFTLRAYLPRANVNLAHRHLTATGHIGVKIRSDERGRQRQQAGL